MIAPSIIGQASTLRVRVSDTNNEAIKQVSIEFQLAPRRPSNAATLYIDASEWDDTDYRLVLGMGASWITRLLSDEAQARRFAKLAIVQMIEEPQEVTQ
jgi:hypothetical protein